MQEGLPSKTDQSGELAISPVIVLPGEEVRKEWNCDGQDAKYSFDNAIQNERNCYVIPHEVDELGNAVNVPKRRKVSQNLQPPTLTIENEGEGKEKRRDLSVVCDEINVR